MLISNSIRTGLSLASDFGVGQNIIYSSNSPKPEFYNTAWTLEIIRNIIIWLLILFSSVPIAKFFDYPELSYILPISSLTLIIYGFSSPGRSLLRKALGIAKLGTFEVIVGLLSSLVLVTTAYLTSTIWALIVGGLAGSAISAVGSFFLMPGLHYRFQLSRRYMSEIIGFGKWIFLSSILFFLSQNFDRLYMAKLIPLDLLGVYGIARGIADLVNTVVIYLGNSVWFPFIASHKLTSREELRNGIFDIRAKFLGVAGLCISILITISDLVVKFLYDVRYHEAAWMLTILLMGAWFALLSGINEAVLLGLGQPQYSLFSNSVKVGFLVVAIQLSFNQWGAKGLIFIISVSEFCRYIPTCIGQRREKFSFISQDLLFTVAMGSCVAAFGALRWRLGFGTSLDALF
jgi:O-antigen/teichoic acid export membrane protein